jgi:hypothetical protein
MREEEIVRLFSGIFGLVSCGLALFLVALVVLVWWKIFAKAGYGGAFGLLMLVPLINLVMLCILAFGTWPVLRELEELKRRQSMQPAVPPPSVKSP